MISINEKLPSFNLNAVVSTDAQNGFQTITDQDFKGQWLVLFAWPKDFTFVCPTEIQGFGAFDRHFKEANAQLLGLSTDSDFVHLAWRSSNPLLQDSPFPWLSDIKKDFSNALGILDQNEGVANRATFIIDPERNIRYASINDMKVGREPKEILRVLKALQTDQLTPCSWQAGEATLEQQETEA